MRHLPSDTLSPAAPNATAQAAAAPTTARGARWAGAAVELGFGLMGLLGTLSILAMIPVLQFLTLGWLLEAEGRLARGGGLRRSLPGLPRLARVGSALAGCALLTLPLAVLHSYHRDAELLNPAGGAARALRQACWLLTAAAALHAALALAAGGGRLRAFFRPLHNALWLGRRVAAGANLRDAAAGWRRELAALRLGHLLALGVKGFVVAAAWLALPTALLAAGTRAPLLGLLGAASLVGVFPWLLVAQGRLAQSGAVRDAFALGEVRRTLARAPLATAAALLLVLGPALPLYAWKVEALPRDALWLPALCFVVALLPGRLLSGWAVARGSRPGRAHWALRLVGLGVRLPIAGLYVFLLFFTQYFAWRGGLGLFAHHAFLLPVAFY